MRHLNARNLAAIVLPVNTAVTDALATRYRPQTRSGHSSSTWLVSDPAEPLSATLRLDDLHGKYGAERSVGLVKIYVEA